MAERVVKRACKYRFYPSDQQTAELSRTFGCVRLVYNRALEARTACVRDGALTYAWPFEDRHVWDPPRSVLLPVIHRLLP